MQCWNCEGCLHPSRLCASPVGCPKSGAKCTCCQGFGHVAAVCTSKGGGKYTEPTGGKQGGKGMNMGKGWGKGKGKGNFHMGKGGKGGSAFDAWAGHNPSGQNFHNPQGQHFDAWAGGPPQAGAMPIAPPWVQPPGLQATGNWGGPWGGPQGGMYSVGVASNKPRQLSLFGMKVLRPVSTSNRFGVMSAEDIPPVNESIQPTVFDKIQWKVKQSQTCRKSTSQILPDKSDEYLYHGKSFPLSNFVEMSFKSRLGRIPPSLLMKAGGET